MGAELKTPAIKQEAVDHFQNILCSDGPSNDQDVYLDNLEGFRLVYAASGHTK